MTTAKTHLAASDWIAAGFRALEGSGPVALKAEALARSLGTTKGSFYWHFKDLPDFKARLLERWRTASEASITTARAADLSPTERLHRLATLKPAGDDTRPALETAIRAWAQSDAAAAETLREVDVLRLKALADVLADIGLTNPDFARLVQAAAIGLDLLPGGDTGDRRGPLSTLLAALSALSDA